MRIAERTLALLRMIEPAGGGRLLLVEPPSPLLEETIRDMGFAGVVNTLVRRAHPLLAVSGDAHGQRIVGDWPAWFVRSARAANTVAATSAEAPLRDDNLWALFEPYDVVLVCNGSQGLPVTTRRAWLALLMPLIVLRGLMLVSFPAPKQPLRRSDGPTVTPGIQMNRLEQSMLPHGAVLAADSPAIAGGDGQMLMVFQKLSVEEAHQVGVVRKATLRQLDADTTLKASLIATYRETFAGDDWREWVRCTRVGCGRHYSRAESERLDPANQCVCGWHLPLQAFHTTESIASKLASELAESKQSCCYVRLRDNRVDGFSWGLLSDAAGVEHTLLADSPRALELHANLLKLLANTCASDGPTAMYYHSELGIAERGRSLSLLRAILQRSLQFAYDRGARVAVTRTSRRARLYPILVGLGMQELLAYATKSDTPDLMAYNADLTHQTEERAADDRVILGGELQLLLRTFLTSSDRRLAVHIANTLRQQRQMSDFNPQHHVNAVDNEQPHEQRESQH